MSEKQTQSEIQTNQEQNEEKKIVTKYDRKVQRRKEEKEREEKEKRVNTILSVVILIALAVLVLSFPIRSYISTHSTFIRVGGENITKVEFDYSYYTVVNNYINTYSQYLGYFGLDTSKDLSKQTYSGDLTWEDYFQEMTVESIQRSKALKADAKAAGFTFDDTADYERYVNLQKSGAEAAGLSLSKYVKQSFGPYATMSRIKPYVKEALYVAAYYDQLTKDMTPDADKIEAAYQEDPDSYDSVDYRIRQFDAVLPTEPTELADPVEDTDEADGSDSENTEYTPSEAEIAKAMSDAKLLADEALTDIKTEGELVDNVLRSSANSVLRDWLFDSSRKPGDTEVLEDTYSNRYYTIAFEKRYRNEEVTADVRLLIADDEEDALGILGDWNSNGATEEAFINLCNDKYYSKAVAEDGLVKGMTADEDIYPELLEWIFAEERKPGDCETVSAEGGIHFVVYYVGEGKPLWYNTIENELKSEAVTAYVNEKKDACTIEDAKKNLHYLEVRAAEEASRAAEEAAENEAGEASDDAASEEVSVETEEASDEE